MKSISHNREYTLASHAGQRSDQGSDAAWANISGHYGADSLHQFEQVRRLPSRRGTHIQNRLPWVWGHQERDQAFAFILYCQEALPEPVHIDDGDFAAHPERVWAKTAPLYLEPLSLEVREVEISTVDRTVRDRFWLTPAEGAELHGKITNLKEMLESLMECYWAR